MEFKASYLTIGPHELVQHLLRESGQQEREAVNPAEILSLLGLRHIGVDFNVELPPQTWDVGAQPRAILSFGDRLVATDSKLIDVRARFSVLHEVAHYVLPDHQHTLYVCDAAGMSFRTRLELEREANEFAAELLFHGDRFTLAANSHPIAAPTVKQLADRYMASFEATARRMVERNFRPCMLIVFARRNGTAQIDIDRPAVWTKTYVVASPAFKATYFADVQAIVVPDEIVAVVTQPGRDIAEGHRIEGTVRNRTGEQIPFEAEFFFNQYNIFCLLIPSKR